MKKYLVVCAAALMLLPCFPLRSQEADDTGSGVGLSIIPRLDLTPVFSDGAAALTLGNSSLYSLFEGDINDNLSFSVCNHWLSAAPGELYAIPGEGANLFRSDWTNWLDWAYLTYSFGSFSISAGKDVVTTGGFELDDYDYDVHPQLQSGLWNNLSCYQWGGKLQYASPSENTTFGLQITSSPYVERPFKDGNFNMSLEWRGNYGAFSNIWSVTSFGADGIIGNPALMLITLGQRYEAGDFTFGLDWFSQSGDEADILLPGSTFIGTVDWAPFESLSFLLKGGREKARELTIVSGTVSETLGTNWFGGLACHYTPVENLRLHAVGGYQSFWETLSFTVGAIYYLNL
ncbi:MAG: hypothetical protein K6F58_06540 [Bacteroidales bacterium]|nr:hypothetical protein [Bacteroidales bacterium]